MSPVGPGGSGMTVVRYAAFTTDPEGGNPAGVVIADTLPTEEEMQRWAAEIGDSETAFVAPRRGGTDLDIRYFSPEREVTFCGHATIATAVALAERDPGLDTVVLVTRTERVRVVLDRRRAPVHATLTSPPASHRAVAREALDEALAAFGWTREVLDPRRDPVVARAGASHLVLPVGSRDVLAAMAYDFDRLRTLMLQEDWTTVDVVWQEAADRVHCRNPFPVGGVVEDPATGAAAAALGGYLRDVGALPASGRLTVLQGHDMGRPSVLEVDARSHRPGIDVGGPAVRLPGRDA